MFGGKDILQYCFIDMSTATSVGKTSIRIHPNEGYGVFFSDVIRDLKLRKGDIEVIINEAKDGRDRVRLVIARQSKSTKSIREYVRSDLTEEEMYKKILEKTEKLAHQTKLHDVWENSQILAAIKSLDIRDPRPNWAELVYHLRSKGIESRFYENQLDIISENSGIYQLTDIRWNGEKWSEM